MGIVFERRRAQEQHVAAQARDRRDRAPGWLAGVALGTPQPLRFVHHQQVDSRLHRLIGQLRPLRQRFERDDGTAMHVERVEPGAEIARDVGETLRIEQREDLVVLAPQLTQPLDRQRIRRDHETALDFSRVHEPIQDQRRFDRLSEADFVCQQPAHRIAGARALRDVKLVRE